MQQSLAALGEKAAWHRSVTIRSDEILVALIALHDRNALRDLFARHSVRVFRYLLRAAGDRAAAEDLLNEVFIDIWRHAGRFEVTLEGVDLDIGNRAFQGRGAAAAARLQSTR